jgi:hypothetical protein
MTHVQVDIELIALSVIAGETVYCPINVPLITRPNLSVLTLMQNALSRPQLSL